MLDLFCSEEESQLEATPVFDKQVFDLTFAGATNQYARRKVELLSQKNNNAMLLPNTKSGNDLISDALNQISLEERERVVKDLHGVNFTNAEDLEAQSNATAETKLEQMESELQRLKAASAWSLQLAGIEMAERQNIAYVQNPAFRVRFLRCEHWDPTKAASRLIRFFDWKLELFGESKLTKDIVLEDLEPEDIKMLKKGYMQRLPERDRAGRMIVISIYNGQTYHSPESLARIWFYMGCANDEESDRKGGILVAFKISDIKFETRNGPGAFILLNRAGSDFPLRWCAMHKFLETGAAGVSRMTMLVDAAISAFSPEIRARLRLHHGSYTEWMYELMTLGVPHQLIPFTSDYKIKTKNHLDYLAMRKTMEEFVSSGNFSSSRMTNLPSNVDVLLGKGKPIQEFLGNLRLAAIIDDYVDEYHQKSKAEKTALAAEMVQKVKASNGRFLSKESGIWIEVPTDAARDKCSHMFRHQRQKANKKGQEMTGNQSSVRKGGVMAVTTPSGLDETPMSKRIKV